MTCGGQRRFIIGLHSRRQASTDNNTNNTNNNDNTSPSTSSSSSSSSSSSNTPSLLATLFSSASFSSSNSSLSTTSSSSPSCNHRQPQTQNGSTPKATNTGTSSHRITSNQGTTSCHKSGCGDPEQKGRKGPSRNQKDPEGRGKPQNSPQNGGTPKSTTTGTSSHRITSNQGTSCHQSGCGDPDHGRKGPNRNQKDTVGGGGALKCPHNNINNNNLKKQSSINNPPSTSSNHCASCSSPVTTRSTSGSCSSDRGRTGCTSPALTTSCWKPLSIMARKRDDKSPARNCGDRQERKMESYLADDENYPSFSNQVVKLGLQLRDIPADGNCLFRALGDQLEGHGRNHYSHRLKVVDYMSKNKKDFAPFVEDNIQFEHYLYTLKKPGTYAGNDAIAAFARLHQVHIVIHQLNSPFLLIQGTKDPSNPQLHIAYHNGDHYSSLRWLHDNTESSADIRLKIYTDDKNKHNKTKISSKTNYRDEKPGVARAVRDVKSIEQEVIGATGCQDREIIQKCLIENEYDVDATIADLLQLLKISRHEEKSNTGKKAGKSESGLWAEKGSGSRIFGNISLNSSSSSSMTSSSSSSLRKTKDTSNHFAEDCMSESSGYGSLGSGSNSGARPKLFIPRVRVL